MNPEESQTPEQIDEWLEQIEAENPKPENSSLESVLETEAPPSSPDIQLNNANLEPIISHPEVADSVIESTEESIVEFAAVQLEVESESPDNSLYAEAEERVAQLQSTEAALKAEIANLELSYKTFQ